MVIRGKVSGHFVFTHTLRQPRAEWFLNNAWSKGSYYREGGRDNTEKLANMCFHIFAPGFSALKPLNARSAKARISLIKDFADTRREVNMRYCVIFPSFSEHDKAPKNFRLTHASVLDLELTNEALSVYEKRKYLTPYHLDPKRLSLALAVKSNVSLF